MDKYRCLVNDLVTQEELILPVTGVFVYDDSGLLKIALRADIDSEKPLYMKVGISVHEIKMIHYGGTRNQLMELRRSCSKKQLRILKRLSLASPITPVKNKNKKKFDENAAKRTKRRPLNDNQENITSFRWHLSDQNILKQYQSRKDEITTLNCMAIQDAKKCLKPVQTQIYTRQKPLVLYKLARAGEALDNKNKCSSQNQSSQITTFFKTLPGVRPLQEIYDDSGATDDNSISSENQSPSPSRRSLQKNLERSSSVSRISEPGQNDGSYQEFSFETLKRRRSSSHRRLLREEHFPRRSPEHRRSRSREHSSDGELSPRSSPERRRPSPREQLSDRERSLRRSPERRRPPPRRRLSREHRSPRRSPSILSSSSDAQDNGLHFSNEDGYIKGDVHITRKDLRSDLKSFRRVILLGMKKYFKNILKKRHNRSTGMVEIFEDVFLEQKWLLKAATARRMSLRANHVMQAYWSRSKRMNLYVKNPKGLRNAIEVQSKEYQDLIDICSALPKINSVRRNKKQNPDINMYKWVRTF